MKRGRHSLSGCSQFWNTEKGKLLEQHDILPHNYLYDIDEFNDSILDETGWDPEGTVFFMGLRVTKAIGKSLNVIWKAYAKIPERQWIVEQKLVDRKNKALPPLKMTRGTGWDHGRHVGNERNVHGYHLSGIRD
jgi:hypothetical protein